MNQQDKKRVKTWLYRISRKELAIANLKMAIQDLDTKLINQPSTLVSGVSNYDLFSGGGGESDSKQDRYASWVELTMDRRDFLVEQLDRLTQEVQRYYDTLEELRKEYGNRVAEIIDYKYRRRVKPDKVIYDMILFCSRESFYREHRWALKFFFDVMCDKFAQRCSCYKCFM